MTVQEFVSEFQKVDKNFVGRLLNDIHVKTYLSINGKRKAIDEITDMILIYRNGIYTYDSLDKDMYFCTGVVDAYTDLIITDQEEDYDALIESGAFYAIVDAIGDDYDLFESLCDKCIDDFLRQNSPASVIDHVLENLKTVLLESTKSMAGDLADVDGEKFKDLINSTVTK